MAATGQVGAMMSPQLIESPQSTGAPQCMGPPQAIESPESWGPEVVGTHEAAEAPRCCSRFVGVAGAFFHPPASAAGRGAWPAGSPVLRILRNQVWEPTG